MKGHAMNSPHPLVADLHNAQRRFDAEAKIATVTTPRYRLEYATWGNPTHRPIVLVHGLCDQKRSFCLLKNQLVDAGFWCISYELADGWSDGAKLDQYQHPHYAEDLIALLDHLKIETTDIMGSSFGSTVTLRSIATYPQRFRRAVLQGGFARRPLTRVERGLAKVGRNWPWRMGQLPIRKRVMSKLEAHQFAGCPPDVFQFLIQCSGATPIRCAARRALILDKLDLRPMLGTITQPLLMIGGNIDTIVPRNWEAEVEAGVKDVRRIEFQPCGHYPQYTMPTPMAAAMVEFLR